MKNKITKRQKLIDTLKNSEALNRDMSWYARLKRSATFKNQR